MYQSDYAIRLLHTETHLLFATMYTALLISSPSCRRFSRTGQSLNCFRRFQFRQCLLELDSEEDGCEGDGDGVGYGFGHVDGVGFVCGPQVGHQVDEWQEQNKFTGYGNDDGADGISDGYEGHLTGDLDAEQE